MKFNSRSSRALQRAGSREGIETHSSRPHTPSRTFQQWESHKTIIKQEEKVVLFPGSEENYRLFAVEIKTFLGFFFGGKRNDNSDFRTSTMCLEAGSALSVKIKLKSRKVIIETRWRWKKNVKVWDNKQTRKSRGGGLDDAATSTPTAKFVLHNEWMNEWIVFSQQLRQKRFAWCSR